METVNLVLVEWKDSRQPNSAWTRLVDFKPEGVCDCVSVGFLIYDGEDYKAIAANMADITSEENIQASGIINIPAICIIKITPLDCVITGQDN